MTVELNTRSMQETLPQLSMHNGPSAAMTQALSNHGACSLVSLAQESERPAETARPAERPRPATREDSERSFCGTVCYVLTAPFRFVAYLATSFWNCICCKKTDEPDATSTVDSTGGTTATTDVDTDEDDDDDSTTVRRSKPNPFERAMRAERPDIEKCLSLFRKLSESERKVYNHYAWVAAGRPQLVDGKPYKAITLLRDGGAANMRVLRDAVEMAQAHRRLSEFRGGLANQKEIKRDDREGLDRAMEKHFDRLMANDTDPVGRRAQNLLVEACALLRGMGARPVASTVEGRRADAAYIAQAIGRFDNVTKTAARLLVENNLSLLSTPEQRKAILHFVHSTRPGAHDHPVSCADAVRHFNTLTRTAPRAADLLLTILGTHLASNEHRTEEKPLEYGQVCMKPDHITEEIRDAMTGFAIALSLMENGMPATASVHRGVAPDVALESARASGRRARASAHAEDAAVAGGAVHRDDVATDRLPPRSERRAAAAAAEAASAASGAASRTAFYHGADPRLDAVPLASTGTGG